MSVFSHSCCDFSHSGYDGWFWLYLGCFRYYSGSYFIFFLADNLLLKFSMKARWWCMLSILAAHFLLYSFQSLPLLCSVHGFLVAKGRTKKEWGYPILVELSDLSFFNTQKLPSRTWLSTRHATNPSFSVLICKMVMTPFPEVNEIMRTCSVAQLCLALCDPSDCSSPGSSVLGISQVRILKWVAIASSRGCCWPRDWTLVTCISCIVGEFFTTEPPEKPMNEMTSFKCFFSFCHTLLWLMGPLVAAQQISCPKALGPQFPDQGSNSSPLHWKADSLPLDHHGSPYKCI